MPPPTVFKVTSILRCVFANQHPESPRRQWLCVGVGEDELSPEPWLWIVCPQNSGYQSEEHLGRNLLLCHPQKPPTDLCLQQSGCPACLHPLWLDGEVLMLSFTIGLQESCISQEGAPLPG